MGNILLFPNCTLRNFYPILAGLYGLSQCPLIPVQSGCFQNLDLQASTIQAEKSIREEKVVESILAQRLNHNPILMPVIIHVPIHVARATFGAFPILHVNLLHSSYAGSHCRADPAEYFVFWNVSDFAAATVHFPRRIHNYV